jgi:hypothetical protein
MIIVCQIVIFLCRNLPQKDIAGIMGTSENLPYLSKGMTGRPTRTLVEFISSLAKRGAGRS